MKKLLIILGVVLVATAMITSCDDPGEEGAMWTVTFDTDGGDPIPAITVENGNSATAPTKYFRAWTPTAAGFYPASQVVKEWQKDGKKFDFTDKITSDIALKAIWENPTKIEPTNPAQGTILEKAITYTNATPDKYILMLDADVEVAASYAINTRYANLTIKGLTSEKTISFKKGAYITVGKDSADDTIGLTLGSNIKLTGVAGTSYSATENNTHALLTVKNRSKITIDGAKITGNASTNKEANGVGGWGCAAVLVDNADFIMKSGEISGNTNFNYTDAADTTFKNSAGAILARNGAKLTLSGGSIKNNINPAATKDVFVTSDSTVTVSGSAEVQELCLQMTGSVNSKVTVSDPSFTGTIGINVRSPTSPAVTWANKVVVEGCTDAIKAKFPSKFNVTDVANNIPALALTVDASGTLK
jgi:hypothetical protein